MNNKGKYAEYALLKEIFHFAIVSYFKLFHFYSVRAQRIHEAKLASIAVRKNRNVQAAAISNTVDNHERFFRNKQRIHNYK